MSCTEEIDNARELLIKAEKTISLDTKIILIEDAKSILESCVDNGPTQYELNKIKNVKKSFIRYLVSQIEKMRLDNPDMFFFYMKTVYLTFNDELNELINEDSKFAAKKEWLDNQFSEEIQSLLKLIS